MVVASMAFATMACLVHSFRELVAWPVVAFARIAVSAVIATSLVLYYRHPFFVKGTRVLWARSLFGSMGLLCNFYCFARMPVTDTISIMATNPLWVTIILVVLFRERMSPLIWFHAALAIAGVFVMQRPSFDAESFPMLIALIGSVFVAGAKVSLGRCGTMPPASVVAHYATCASIFSLAMCFLAADSILLTDSMPASRWLWLLPMGLAGTFGQLLMTHAFGLGNTAVVALVGMSQIAFSAFYDVLIFGHSFDVWKIVGILMIATAIAMSITTTRNAPSRALAIAAETSTPS